MTRTTQELRVIYSPACATKHRVGWLEAYQALDATFRKYNYHPKSGQTGSFNCRHITGGSGYSLHAYEADFIFTFWTGVRVTVAEAVDVNWNANPYGSVLHTDMPRAMVDEIVAIKTVNGAQVWRWGGYYSGNKDAMHYEIVASPSELASGIEGTSGKDWWDLATPAEIEKAVHDGTLSALHEFYDDPVTKAYMTWKHVSMTETDANGHKQIVGADELVKRLGERMSPPVIVSP